MKKIAIAVLSVVLMVGAWAQDEGEAPPPPPPVDALGDALPERAQGRLGTDRLRHGDAEVAVSFSEDGTQIFSAGRDQNIHIWDTKSGARVATFGGHEGPITTAALSWRDWLIVSGSVDRSVRLWEPESGVLL